jgi:hypothetical protein
MGKTKRVPRNPPNLGCGCEPCNICFVDAAEDEQTLEQALGIFEIEVIDESERTILCIELPSKDEVLDGIAKALPVYKKIGA